MPPPKQKKRETAASRLEVAPSKEDLLEQDSKRRRVQSKNTFKFLNLKARAKVASNSLSRVKLAESDTFSGRVERKGGEDTRWHFQDELRLLHQDIDRSTLFREFYHEVAPISATLPLLLHHLEEVVSCFSKYVQGKLSEENRRSFLKLCGLMSKDVRVELKDHMPELLKSVMKLVDESNPEHTASVFKTVSVLLANVPSSLSILKPFYPAMLGSRKQFVRELASKAFASALRRVDSKAARSHMKHVLSSVAKSEANENPDLRDGLSSMIFETLKNVRGEFHSKHVSSFPALLKLCLSTKSSSNSAEETFLQDTMSRTSTRMRRYTSVSSCEKIWKSFHSVLDKAWSESDDQCVSRVLNLIADWVSHKRGDLVSRAERKRLKSTLSSLMSENRFTKARFNLLARSWIALYDDDEVTHPLLNIIEELIDSVGKRIAKGDFVEARVLLRHLELPEWSGRRIQQSLIDVVVPRFCACVCKAIESRGGTPSKEDLLFLLLKLSQHGDFDSNLSKQVLKVLSMNLKEASSEILWACLASVQQQHEHVSDETKTSFETRIKKLLDAVPSTKEEKVVAVECAKVCSLLSLNSRCVEGIETWLKQSPACPFALRAAYYYKTPQSAHNVLTNNLSHSSQVVRLRTLRALARAKPENVMVKDLLYVERNGRNPMQERNIRARTEQIAARLKSKLISNADATMMIKHVLGLTNIRYARIWPTLKKLLQSTSTHYFQLMWPLLVNFLEKLIFIDRDMGTGIKDSAVSSNDDDEEEEEKQETIETLMNRRTSNLVFPDRDDLGANNKMDETSLASSKRTAIVLEAMAMFSRHVETKNRDVVSLFFRCLQNEFSRPALMSQDPDAWDLVRILSLSDVEAGSANGSIQSGVERINAFLQVFSSFQNLKASYKSDLLYRVCTILLARSRTSVRTLECVLAFNRSEIKPYNEFLKRLADHDTKRDEMALFSLETEEIIKDEDEDKNKRALRLESSHRCVVIPLVIKIVYGLISQRRNKGKGARGGTSLAERNALITFLSAMKPDEIEIFLRRLTRVFYTDPPGAVEQNDDDNNESMSNIKRRLESITITRQVAFLNTCISVVQCMSRVLISKLDIVLRPVIAILQYVQSSTEKNISNEDRSRLRQLVFKLLADIWERYPDADWKHYSPMYISILKNLVAKIPSMVTGGNSVPSLMLGLRAMSSSESLWFHFRDGNFVVPLVKVISLGYDARDELKSANDHVVNILFDIFENLTENMTASPLLENVEIVLEHLHIRFSQSSMRGVATSKMVRSAFALRSLRLLAHLGDVIASKLPTSSDLHDTASKLVQLLLPFLEPTADSSSNIKVYILHIISKIVPHLESFEWKSNLIRLLGPNKGFDSRHDRVELTRTISKMLSDNTLIELNAFEENTLSNEYDFERRSKAFKSINKEERFKNMDPTLLEAVLRHYIWCLRDSEMLIRRFSSTGVSNMLRYFATCKDETITRVFVRNVTFSGLRVWIQDFKTTEVVRRELFVLLTEAISLFAELSDHPGLHGDLACLCRPNDIEADFWRNLLHTQMHRRIRALRRMATSIQNGTCKPTTFSVVHLLLPIVLRFVNENFTHKYAELRSAAYEVLPVLARCLSWKKYLSSISSLLRTQSGPKNAGGFDTASRDRARIQAVCALLDAFDAFEQNQGVISSLEKKLLPLMLSKLLIKKNEDDQEQVNIPIALAMVKLLKCLPQQLFEIHVDKVFHGVALVLRSRSQITRDDARNTYVKMAISAGTKMLPMVIQRLRDALKSGYQKHVLGFVTHAVLQGMESSFEKDGANQDAIYRALPDLIAVIDRDIFGDVARQRSSEGFNPNVRMREMRACRSFESFQLLCRFIPFLPSDAFGLLMGPIRRQIVALDPMRVSKDAPILTTQEQNKQVRRIREILRHGVRGLSKNRTVEILPMMHLVYSLLCEHFRLRRRRVSDGDDDDKNSSTSEEEDDDDSEDESKSFYSEVDVLLDSSSTSSKYSETKQKRIAKSKGVGAWLVSGAKSKIDPRDRKATKLANAVVLPEPRLTGIDQDRRSGAFFKKKKQNENGNLDEDTPIPRDLGQHGHLMVQFGVSLLHMFVKKGRVSKSEQEHLEMMDPMIALLTLSAKKARNDEILLASLRCITAVATWPLPSILKYSKTITSIVFKVLIQFGTNAATADLAQGCFKTLTKILQSKTWNVKPNQLKVLITLLESSIEIPQKQKASFELVHALVAARVVNAQIYGLIDSLQDLLIESQHDFVRHSSSDILMRYLLTYPLSQKRLLAHLNFFLKNLDFVYESGRISVLTLLQNIIRRFPVPMLDENSRIIFLPLVLRIANDESLKARKLATENVSNLFERCGDKACASLFELTMNWLRQKAKPVLRTTAAQVLGVVSEKRLGLIKKNLKDILEYFTEILSSAIACDEENDETMSASLTRQSDRATYHVLNTLQRLILAGLAIPETPMRCAMDCLLAPHAWVRLKASCVLGLFFSKTNAKKVNKCNFLGQSDLIFELVRRSCQQLESSLLNDVLAEQVVKNLVFLGQCMWYHPALCRDADTEVEDDVSKKFHPIRWILKRLSVLTRPGLGVLTPATSLRQQSSIRFFAAIAMTLPVEATRDFLSLILTPIVSIVTAADREDAAAQLSSRVRTKKKRKRGAEDNVESEKKTHRDITISLGREVLDLFQDRYDNEYYLKTYGDVMRHLKEARANRKRERALEKVMHPDLHAERKRKKQKRYNENRKKKIAEIKARS